MMIRVLSILSSIILISCSGNELNNEKKKNEIPQVLQESNEIKLKRYNTRYENLTEDLYQELVANSPELKKLEIELEEFNPQETKEKFFQYDLKTQDYNLSAKNIANTITDSVAKNKIIAYINKSKENYFYKTKEINGILKEIQQKQNTIADCHSILKIVLTMPIIENYQNENLPSKTEFINIVEKQNKLIEKTKKLTPNY